MLNIEIVREAGRRARLFAFGTKAAKTPAQEKTVSTLVIDVKTEVDQEAIDALEAQLERIAALQEQINDSQAPFEENNWNADLDILGDVQSAIELIGKDTTVINEFVVSKVFGEFVETPEGRQRITDIINRPAQP